VDVHSGQRAAARAEGGSLSRVVDAKGMHAVNGLQTSSFTVCARIRPVLPKEESDVENFT
jgi:hypothetical protein